MAHQPKEFNLGELNGISAKTNEIHEKKLYAMDHGSDRKSYLEAFFRNVNWRKVDELYNQVALMVQ